MIVSSKSIPLNKRLELAWNNVQLFVKKDKKYGTLAGPLLQGLALMGLRPKFDDMNDAEVIGMINTAVEVLCMIRDDDPESEDERAREIYRTLFTSDRTE